MVGEFHDRSLQGYKQRTKIVLFASDSILGSYSFKNLLRETALGALTEPMRWDSIVSSLTSSIQRHEFTEFTIYQVLSMSGPFHILWTIGNSGCESQTPSI